MDKNLKLAAIGINYKSADMQTRELFQIPKHELKHAMETIYQYDECHSCLILATCNRLEFYLVTEKDSSAYYIMEKFYRENRNFNIESYIKNLYDFEGQDVTNHLFRVVSGLESMVLGEFQIQGQIKEAYSTACNAKSLDKVLHKLLHGAFRTGKKVRTDTNLGAGKFSVAGVAAKYMIEKLDKDSQVLIIGVNESTKILAQALNKANFKNFIFLNRTAYKAQMMADTYGGRSCEMDNILNCLALSDAIFSCTGSADYIIGSHQIESLISIDRLPKMFVDMAVPRDIDNTRIPGYSEYLDIAVLKEYLEEERASHLKDIPDAEKIIADEVNRFHAWSDADRNDLLDPFNEKFEIVRQGLVDEYRDQFPEQDKETIDKMTKSLVHRMKSVFICAMLKEEKI